MQNSSVHEERRLEYLARMKIERENFGVALQFTNKRISPRRILREVVNIKNGSISPTNSVKRDRHPSMTPIVSPSKIRHKLFVDQAKTLTPGERLVRCPLCTSPSRVSIIQPPDDSNVACSSSGPLNLQSHSKAECSSPKCQFLFCPDCQCQEHPGQSCRGSARPQSTRATRADARRASRPATHEGGQAPATVPEPIRPHASSRWHAAFASPARHDASSSLRLPQQVGTA